MVRILLPGLLLFLFLAGPAGSEETEKRVLDPKTQMGLGDFFFEDGDFYRALTEYRRFLYFFPENPRVQEALWKIANSYFQGRRWDEALRAAEDLLKKFPASPWRADSLLLMGRCWMEKGDLSQARREFQRVRELAPESSAAHQAQWETARSYLREERWKEAAAEFRKVDPGSKWFPRAEVWAGGLERIDEVPRKSPTAAGILAILPGAGHLYTERYRDAAIAFVLNGAFLWGMVEAFQHKNYVVGGILTFFELGWYSGNIYSAVSSAHKYNRSRKKEYLEGLEAEARLSLGVILRDQRPLLAFRYAF